MRRRASRPVSLLDVVIVVSIALLLAKRAGRR
jgi:hypothetical protein